MGKIVFIFMLLKMYCNNFVMNHSKNYIGNKILYMRHIIFMQWTILSFMSEGDFLFYAMRFLFYTRVQRLNYFIQI